MPSRPVVTPAVTATSIKASPTWLYTALIGLAVPILIAVAWISAQQATLNGQMADLKYQVEQQDRRITDNAKESAKNVAALIEIETQLRGFDDARNAEKSSRLMMDALLYEQVFRGREFPDRQPHFPEIATAASPEAFRR